MRYAGQAFELPVPGAARARPGRPRRALRARPRGALRPPRPRRRGRPRRHPPGAGRSPAPSRARRPRPTGALEREHRGRSRFGGEWVETPGPARRARGRDRAPRARSSSSCPRRPWSCRPAGAPTVDERRHDRRAVRRPTMREEPRDERARPDHPAGADRRPARRLRRDGRDADPLRLLGQHQGAPRLLDRALRRRRRAGDAGRAHPRPPRLDARRGRRRARRGARARASPGSSTTPTAAAPTCPTSP